MAELDVDALRRTVLVVEDDAAIREMVQKLFSSKGYTVLDAVDGEGALARLSSESVGVMLVDKNLPGTMDGLDILRSAAEVAPYAKAIMMTAFPSTDSAVEALRLGAFDYLRKPFRLDEVVEKVERAFATIIVELEYDATLEHHNTLFETIPGVVWFATDNGRFRRINRIGAGLLGYDPEEIVGSSYEDLLAEPTDDPAVHWAFKERRTGERTTRRLLVEFKTAHGGRRMFDLFSSGVYLSAKIGDNTVRRFWGTMGVAFDVTDMRLQQEVQQAQKLEAIGQLAGGVAHDLNNLLSVVLTNAVLLEETLPADDPAQEEIQDIIDSARKGGALTRNLLGFARKSRTVTEPVSLTDTADEVVSLLRRTAPKAVSIQTSLEPDLWLVQGDAAQLSQVVLNLCLNGVDAMDGRGVLTLSTANVDIERDGKEDHPGLNPGSHVRLQVVDTGSGMDEHVLKRAFEPFFTTKEVGQGTGLGLSMAYGTIQQHCGVLFLESDVGSGTTATVLLPAAGAPTRTTGKQPVEPMPAPGGTVLIVDDEHGVRRAGERLLQRLGYNVLQAEDGEMALEVYQGYQQEIELVILDVAMPVMDGIECFQRLREINPNVRVLLCSGYPSGHELEKALQAGGCGFLSKPFETWQFSKAVARLLAE